ncbi:sigma-54-dependent transcriptional regulator [Terriglobus aquaticus]|uniref:Sigma-54-dependent transcriptional regulator n=1 Tax=Terriglobus aquaticus TaxID=940139 RepID=A0ABW9KPA2_9BACT|nr:sigma-54 dependent transcriptional regulator [Terriglobus aquaticus]
MKHVLVVDDEADIRSLLEEILRDEGYIVTTSGSAVEAMELIRDAEYDAVLLDIWLPDGDGLDVLGKVRDLNLPSPPEIIMISGHGTIESAVRATKLGAYDFLEKPLSLERTLLMLKNAIEARQLRRDNRELQQQLAQTAYVTGESVPMKALRQQIRLMAPTNGRVLIFGESGTGKERIARTMHAQSQRADRVFVELNCAAIPENHIESELFGHRHGAVDGGAHEKRGTFERADGGTLFLDEVGDMSLKTQAKVLRALDEQRFYPVGAHNPVHVDVRVIAATNKNLDDEIARGNFREDLFYRLNVIPFYVPPLRDRIEDLPLLAHEFLQEFGRQYGRPRVEIASDAVAALQNYRWPGNVRELRNVIERVLILNPKANRIERKHLPTLAHRELRTDGVPAADGSRGSSLAEGSRTLVEAREAYERDYILKKLDDCHGNVSRAAEALGLERSHLYRKMKALGVPIRE